MDYENSAQTSKATGIERNNLGLPNFKYALANPVKTVWGIHIFGMVAKYIHF